MDNEETFFVVDVLKVFEWCVYSWSQRRFLFFFLLLNSPITGAQSPFVGFQYGDLGYQGLAEVLTAFKKVSDDVRTPWTCTDIFG